MGASVSSANPAIWMPLAVAHSTFLTCRFNTCIWREGIGNVVVSRRSARGDVVYVNFLVDTYCLGVKDLYYRSCSQAEFESEVLN